MFLAGDIMVSSSTVPDDAHHNGTQLRTRSRPKTALTQSDGAWIFPFEMSVSVFGSDVSASILLRFNGCRKCQILSGSTGSGAVSELTENSVTVERPLVKEQQDSRSWRCKSRALESPLWTGFPSADLNPEDSS